MSWGATAFTPMISFNTPPFGFAERNQPSDFTTCPENPWVAAENLKADFQSYFDEKHNNSHNVLEPFSNSLPPQLSPTNMMYVALFLFVVMLYISVQ